MASDATGYRQLVVWKKSMQLVKQIYQITELLPANERYGLCSQAQRASVSIPANIAEGSGCGGGDYPRFIRISRGSLMELEVYLELFVTLGFIPREKIVDIWKLSQEVGAMLTRLLQSLETKNQKLSSRASRDKG